MREIFSALGEVRLYDPPVPVAELRPAQLLLVRSVSRVDAKLLRDSRVRVVGTASSGHDHLDTAALEAAGIGWVTAQGSNARAVAEHVLGILCLWSRRQGISLRRLRVGIIGCGRIGSCLAAMLETIGCRCLRNDPPRARHEPGRHYHSLEQTLQADVISLHVPLTRHGPDRTWKLLDARRLQRLRPGTLLINTARGGVVDESALKPLAECARISTALDVWQNEPELDWALLRSTWIGTPHVAGYSHRARHHAPRLLYQRICEQIGTAAALLPAPAPEPARLSPPATPMPEALCPFILAVADPSDACARLRAVLQLPGRERAQAFGQLRATYPLRSEFGDWTPDLAAGGLLRTLDALGFGSAPQNAGRRESRRSLCPQ